MKKTAAKQGKKQAAAKRAITSAWIENDGSLAVNGVVVICPSGSELTPPMIREMAAALKASGVAVGGAL